MWQSSRCCIIWPLVIVFIKCDPPLASDTLNLRFSHDPPLKSTVFCLHYVHTYNWVQDIRLCQSDSPSQPMCVSVSYLPGITLAWQDRYHHTLGHPSAPINERIEILPTNHRLLFIDNSSLPCTGCTKIQNQISLSWLCWLLPGYTQQLPVALWNYDR